MAVDRALRPVEERGWRTGFGNLFHKESADWWSTRSLLRRSILSIGVVNGLVAMVVYTAKTQGMPEGAAAGLAQDSVMLFTQLTAVFLSVAIVIRTQGAIIGEKQSGVAAWILSKPVSRAAYIFSKFAGIGLGSVVTMLAVESLVFYFQLVFMVGVTPGLLQFITGVLALVPVLIFYIGLTLMLGTFFASRGPVVGIPLAVALGSQLIIQFLPWTYNLLPYGLSGVSASLMLGQALTDYGPLVMTPVLGIAFLFTAVWRFGREDL